jgi:hypothetical protein
MSLKIILSCVSYFMINSNHANCISQHRQIHVGTHIYHMCNILSNFTIMLDFLIVTNIVTFDLNHDGHI